jgi:hypothetical protein
MELQNLYLQHRYGGSLNGLSIVREKKTWPDGRKGEGERERGREGEGEGGILTIGMVRMTGVRVYTCRVRVRFFVPKIDLCEDPPSPA